MFKLNLMRLDESQLALLVTRQLNQLIPDNYQDLLPTIQKHLSTSLHRLHICINAVRCWNEDHFDYLHSTQYCIFLYFLSNTIWIETGEREIPTRLFLLNKSLNAIDLFYEIEMPPRFFIGHSVGIVLAKATYGDYFVLYQNSTVGKNHGVGPIIESGVIMYPNTAIIGSCHIRSNTALSQGVGLVDTDTPGNCLVFRNSDSRFLFKDNKRDYLGDIFRI